MDKDAQSSVHGQGTMLLSHTPEYRTWCRMKQRCYNPNNASYKYYGGRGIKVCEKWLNDFQAFFQDMGYRPSNKYSIERVNNNGNYEPDNCVWILNTEQNCNKRAPTKNRQSLLDLKEAFCTPCGKSFTPTNKKQRFCSTPCKNKHHAYEYTEGKAKVAGEGKGHRRKLETSEKLQRLFHYLKRMSCKPVSTLDIQNSVKICATSTVCSELRHNLKRTDLPKEYKGWRLPDSWYLDGVYVYQIEKKETVI